jgi:hypothetical protein
MNSSSGSTPRIETERGGRLEGLLIIGKVAAGLVVGRIELFLTFEALVLAVLGEPDGRARFSGGGVGSLSLSESVPGDDMVDG